MAISVNTLAHSVRVSLPFLVALLGFMLLAVPIAWAGPVEFGWTELNRALNERNLAPMSIKTEITAGAPESYCITAESITGGDGRGVMYGLLEAAEQIRRTGRVQPAEGRPATSMRGIRTFVHNEEMDKAWYFSNEYWNSYFAMLAKNRFNRFNLVFASQTNYLAPPFPFWVELPEFPKVQVPGLDPAQRQRNLQMLCHISQAAADHGVDFTLGVWQFNVMPGQIPTVEGITRKDIGPYSYAALKKVLQTCPAIRSVQMRTNTESGIPDEQQVSFYRDWIYRAIREAGRPVTLDLRSHYMSPGMMDAATTAGVPLRMSSKYWAEHMVRPYQPTETVRLFSYLDLLKQPSRKYDFFWEIWTLGSHRLLLWGDPDYVRRAVPTFALADAVGFEIDAPLAQKGFGNEPGTWGIFAADQYSNHEDRKFWNWEFERYWLFYRLWGRLSYDPDLSKDLWLDELKLRFGNAASDVLAGYQGASKVISEIVAAHMADPNMYVWPEINPGGPTAYYKDVSPGDPRFVASPAEAARSCLKGVPSAKQGPRETARLLDGIATEIEAAVARAEAKLGSNHKEWRGTEPDFQVLSLLARYHARKQEAAYSLSWFYETGNAASLDGAEANIRKARDIWQALVKLTDGLYPDQMNYVFEDIGHWKDKLRYVHHDLRWIAALKRTWEKYGGYDFRYDFGKYVAPPRLPSHQHPPFMTNQTIEPRFTLVHPSSNYSEDTGYGWAGQPLGQITAHSLQWFEPGRSDIRATNARPTMLPENALFGDWLNVPDLETFRVRTGTGSFEAIKLYADGSEERQTLSAYDGVVDVVFPKDGRTHQVSGLLVRNLANKPSAPVEERYPKPLPRPTIIHTPSRTAVQGQTLKLPVNVVPRKNVTGIRLHYRSLNAWEKIRTLEVSGATATFTIPARDISRDFDLLYYFEILNSEKSGWFHPNPEVATPYYVVSAAKP